MRLCTRYQTMIAPPILRRHRKRISQTPILMQYQLWRSPGLLLSGRNRATIFRHLPDAVRQATVALVRELRWIRSGAAKNPGIISRRALAWAVKKLVLWSKQAFVHRLFFVPGRRSFSVRSSVRPNGSVLCQPRASPWEWLPKSRQSPERAAQPLNKLL